MEQHSKSSTGCTRCPTRPVCNLQEFLAISRSDAIVLLEKFDGSVEAVFADKLGAD